MKLLIVTQVVDTEHPVLGFFHRWIEEFAKHCEQVHVICLQAGKHSLPANVTVHSLGKEMDKGRFIYLFRFYSLIWQLRQEYDSVFVHMNQIYVVLGALLWRALGKRVGLWYMHGTVSRSLRIAEKLTHVIFTGSRESCRLKSAKVMVTGHGVDTNRFSPNPHLQKRIDLVTVGRITPMKNVLELVGVFARVRQSRDVSLTIVGESVIEVEQQYELKVRQYIAEHGLADYVHFLGRVSQAELPSVLNQARVFVTMAQNGSLDKAMLEAMACGVVVVSTAPGSVSLPLGANQVDTPEALRLRLEEVLTVPGNLAHAHVEYVQANHSITSLIQKLVGFYCNTQ